MDDKAETLNREQHQQVGIELYNLAWEYLEKTDRSDADNDHMLHAAHASCWHWLQCGTELNHARGLWQIARIYAELRWGEMALHFAKACLRICEENGYGDFDFAYALEQVARAYGVLGDKAECEEYILRAKEAAKGISHESDREYFLKELATVQVFSE